MPIQDPNARNKGREWSYLEDELCFDLWNELGTARKAARALEQRGVRNPDTGNPPTPAGVYIAALRYAAFNIEESRQKIINAGGGWAQDRLKHLMWIFERVNKQSNLLGKRRRDEFNESTLEFAVSHLDPDDYESFLNYYREIVGENCDDGRELEPA